MPLSNTTVVSRSLTQYKPKRDSNGYFVKGYSGNPGGDAGRARRELNRLTIEEMTAEFKRNGKRVIAAVSKNNPAMFLKMLVLLVPRELEVMHSGGVKAMTDEQLERSLEVLKELIARREAAENAKVIEATATPIPPSDGPKKPKKRKLFQYRRKPVPSPSALPDIVGKDDSAG